MFLWLKNQKKRPHFW